MARKLRVEAPPKSDAYTGMLIISLLALVAGCAFLYLDWSAYSKKGPDKTDLEKVNRLAKPADQPQGGGAGGAPGGAGGGGGMVGGGGGMMGGGGGMKGGGM